MPFMPNHPSEKDFGALPVGGDKPPGTVAAAPGRFCVDLADFLRVHQHDGRRRLKGCL